MGKLKGILTAAGAGAKETLKSADVDALGQFKGKIQKVIDDIDNPTDELGGDLGATQDKMAKKKKKKKKLTAEQQKLKELKDAEKGAKKDVSKTDDEIALEIANKDLGIGGNLYDLQDSMVNTKTKTTSKLKK